MSLDRSRLDFEQSSRIEKILDSRNIDGEDTPEIAASQLMPDRLLWLTLADRPQSNERQIAGQQLNFLLGENLRFEPNASEKTRQEQLAEIRRRIESAVHSN